MEDERGESKKTPLHLACEKGYQDMVELLIQNGSDVKAIDKDGENALSLACTHGRYKTVIWLSS